MRPLSSYDWPSIARNIVYQLRFWAVDLLAWMMLPVLLLAIWMDARSRERPR